MIAELRAMGQKSFYGKAFVELKDKGIVLYSYNTPVLR